MLPPIQLQSSRHIDTKEPLPGVTITVQETGFSSISSASPSAGVYAISLGVITQGIQKFNLIAKRDGFNDAMETVSSPNENDNKFSVRFDIFLQPVPDPAPGSDPVPGPDLPIAVLQLLLSD